MNENEKDSRILNCLFGVLILFIVVTIISIGMREHKPSKTPTQSIKFNTGEVVSLKLTNIKAIVKYDWCDGEMYRIIYYNYLGDKITTDVNWFELEKEGTYEAE